MATDPDDPRVLVARDPADIVGDFEDRLRKADELARKRDLALPAIAHYLSAFGHLAADLLLNEIDHD